MAAADEASASLSEQAAWLVRRRYSISILLGPSLWMLWHEGKSIIHAINPLGSCFFWYLKNRTVLKTKTYRLYHDGKLPRWCWSMRPRCWSNNVAASWSGRLGTGAAGQLVSWKLRALQEIRQQLPTRDMDFQLELCLFSKAGNDYVLWDIDVQKRGYTIWIRVLVFVYEFVSQDGRMRENSAKQEKTENLIYIKLEHPAFWAYPSLPNGISSDVPEFADVPSKGLPVFRICNICNICTLSRSSYALIGHKSATSQQPLAEVRRALWVVKVEPRPMRLGLTLGQLSQNGRKTERFFYLLVLAKP